MVSGIYVKSSSGSTVDSSQHVDDVAIADIWLPDGFKHEGNYVVRYEDGVPGSRIPAEDYLELREHSLHNEGSETLVLGRWANDDSSYIKVAERDEAMYFDMGDDWNRAQEEFGLQRRDEMFDFFIRPALDEAIRIDMNIRFSHDRCKTRRCAVRISKWNATISWNTGTRLWRTQMGGQQSDRPALELAKGVQSSTRAFFGERATGFGVKNLVEDPAHLAFSILFEAYEFVPVIFNYDRGFFAFAVDYGSRSVLIEPRDGGWASFDKFDRVLQQLDKELRLRIPDKYLDAKGW